MILACDVGGTSCRLALLEERGGRWHLARLETFPSRSRGSLEEHLTAFLGNDPVRLDAAGFGVAGPVVDGEATITNLPWKLEARAVARLLGLPSVSLLNDVEAHAWSIERLGPESIDTLHEGRARDGTVAIVAAGTGLGLAALVGRAGARVSLASEGGHADFAPRDELQDQVTRALRARFGQASVERVVSGPGLVEVHQVLRELRAEATPGWLSDALRDGDAAATIAQAAAAGRDATCAAALDFFLDAYGAEAGHWALRTQAVGGVYLGGGIAPRLLGRSAPVPEAWRLRARARVLEAFLGNSRLRATLEGTPLRLMLDPFAALLGAAHHAHRATSAAGLHDEAREHP